jgi:hypothetical protein
MEWREISYPARNRALDLPAFSLITIHGAIPAGIASKTGKQLSVFDYI